MVRSSVEGQLARGEKIRLAVVIEDDFGWFKPGAFWEDPSPKTWLSG